MEAQTIHISFACVDFDGSHRKSSIGSHFSPFDSAGSFKFADFGTVAARGGSVECAENLQSHLLGLENGFCHPDVRRQSTCTNLIPNKWHVNPFDRATQPRKQMTNSDLIPDIRYEIRLTGQAILRRPIKVQPNLLQRCW
jgi:hypothetical protein